jgi:hypothetical protein
MSLRDKIMPISWSWREGEYIDFWSGPHFLSGVLLGFVGYLVPLPFSEVFLLVLALLIIYEMWEAAIEIGEYLENSVLDVVLAIFGFIGAYRLSEMYLTDEVVLVFSGILALALALLATVGWQAYLQRG